MPEIVRIVETAIYVNNLEQAADFYGRILGLEKIGEQVGRHLIYRVGDGIFLIFNPESTCMEGNIPPHGAKGSGHFALGVQSHSELDAWKSHLTARDIEIEREMSWPKGGHSLYFRDPEGNLVELVTPGVWGLQSGW